MKKEYKVTDELVDKMNARYAHETLRDIYVKLPFMHKRAVKSAIEAEKLRTDFWYGVRELYPEFRDKELAYRQDRRTLTVNN